VKAGTEIGAYRVLAQIGQGGMGSVWMAEHTMLGRRAAIKLLHPMFTSQPDVVKRFFNEARAATAISDPGIVQIFDFGHDADGAAYIAMELLEGEPLNRRLKRLGRLPAVDALRILRQVAASLGVAHQGGIVHRDLKPENIFLVRDPEVPGGERAKLLDFGIAKLTHDTGEHTQTSAVIGTPTYMSPEQCRGAGHVDQRSDVYALGCVLFALLTGRPPFQAMGSGEIIAMHLREAPPLLSSRAPELAPELGALVARCLEKDPELRFASGAELAAELGALLAAASTPGTSGMHGGYGRTPAPAGAPMMMRAQTGPVAGPAMNALMGMPTEASDPSSVPYSMGTPWPTSPQAATTLSSGVHTASNHLAVAPVARWSSRRTVLVSAALVLGVGGAVAVGIGASGDERAIAPANGATAPAGGTGTSAAAAPAPASTPAPVATPGPTPVAPGVPSTPEDPARALAAPMQDVLRAFVAWSGAHAGEPCPTLEALGSSATDPWGHPLLVTCTDQPASQRIGVISTGPDGVLGSRDDTGSWQLAREVTDLAHGPRWAMAAPVGRPADKPPSKPLSADRTPASLSKPVAPASKPARPGKPKRPIASDIPTER
jgi:eukaryotic-like serine/threonine-protein kinase